MQDGIIKVDKALEKKMRKEQKRLKKETKKARKEEKRLKRRLKEEQLELDKKIEDDVSWKKQKKLIDLGPVKVMSLSVTIFQCFYCKFSYGYFSFCPYFNFFSLLHYINIGFLSV